MVCVCVCVCMRKREKVCGIFDHLHNNKTSTSLGGRKIEFSPSVLWRSVCHDSSQSAMKMPVYLHSTLTKMQTHTMTHSQHM